MKLNLSERLLNMPGRSAFEKIIKLAVIWVFPWFFLRYGFTADIMQDNDYISNHASVVVYCQTIAAYYLTSSYIFPNFLYKRKFVAVALFVILLMNVAHWMNYYEIKYLATLSEGNLKVKPSYLQKAWRDYYKPYGLLGVFKSSEVAYLTFVWSYFVVAILLFIKLIKDILGFRTGGLKLERDKLKLENDKLQLERDNLNLEIQRFQLQSENLTLELGFLKAQINPHFLFNILNSLYLRTVDLSGEASDIVLKLSDLMRYSLYSVKEDKVYLQNEISYIQNYLDLENYRRSKELAGISMTVNGNIQNKKIAPLLLISFVENAFKHSLDQSAKESFIKVTAEMEGGTLNFLVENSFDKLRKKQADLPTDQITEGIGLSNTRKRLNLLYPGLHTLTIDKTEHIYKITLNIELDPI